MMGYFPTVLLLVFNLLVTWAIYFLFADNSASTIEPTPPNLSPEEKAKADADFIFSRSGCAALSLLPTYFIGLPLGTIWALVNGIGIQALGHLAIGLWLLTIALLVTNKKSLEKAKNDENQSEADEKKPFSPRKLLLQLVAVSPVVYMWYLFIVAISPAG